LIHVMVVFYETVKMLSANRRHIFAILTTEFPVFFNTGHKTKSMENLSQPADLPH